MSAATFLLAIAIVWALACLGFVAWAMEKTPRPKSFDLLKQLATETALERMSASSDPSSDHFMVGPGGFSPTPVIVPIAGSIWDSYGGRKIVHHMPADICVAWKALSDVAAIDGWRPSVERHAALARMCADPGRTRVPETGEGMDRVRGADAMVAELLAVKERSDWLSAEGGEAMVAEFLRGGGMVSKIQNY